MDKEIVDFEHLARYHNKAKEYFYGPENQPPVTSGGASVQAARFTIPASAWNSLNQAVLTSALHENLAKITTNSLIDLRPADNLVDGSSECFVASDIVGYAQGAGSITLKCETKPTKNVGIEIIIYNEGGTK